jgi:PadR family transcriptional regulator, regulatory protein AphA
MSLRYVLLALIAERPRYGYELKHDAERLLGSGAELNPGQLYPLLRKLADQQLLTDERIEQEDRPDKRVFTLTATGAQDLCTWLAEPVPPQGGRSPLFLRFVVLALVKPEACAEFFQRQRHILLEHLGQLVADRIKRANSDDLATNALREATILHTEADLKWLEWLEAQVPAANEPAKEHE